MDNKPIGDTISLRVLIVRTTCRRAEKFKGDSTYNLQEVGLARALVRAGHVCDIVVFGGSKNETRSIEVDSGRGRFVKLFFLKGFALYDAGLYYGLNELAKDYDIIQPAEYDQVQTWLLAGSFPDKTVVYHGPYYSDFYKRYALKCSVVDRLFVPRYAREGTQFVTKSAAATDFLESKGIKNVKSVGVGLDLCQLQRKECNEEKALVETISECRKQDDAILLYVGRIEPRRNPFLLIDIMKLLRSAGVKAHLCVVGAGDASYVESWKKVVSAEGVASSISYAPRLPQASLPYLYEASDLFLLPTSYEIFGMVLLESMYFGCASVSTLNGGSSALIENGVNGSILESLDAETWADEIVRLTRDKEGLSRMGAAASATISRGFTWDALAPKFLQVYRSVLERSS